MLRYDLGAGRLGHFAGLVEAVIALAEPKSGLIAYLGRSRR